MTRTSKEFSGTILTYSKFTYGGYVQYRYLLDSGTTLGTNVNVATTSDATLPTGSTGLALDNTFVYRTPFSSKTEIDGRIEGTVICRLSTDNAITDYVELTGVGVNIFKYRSDGSVENIVPYTSIWSGIETQYGAGVGNPAYRDIGVLYAFDVEDSLPTDALLALRVKLYGFKSASSSNLKIQLLCSHTSGDLKLVIPLLGGE